MRWRGWTQEVGNLPPTPESGRLPFQEHGFDAITLQTIAAKAGVPKQTVLQCFGSKEAIAMAFWGPDSNTSEGASVASSWASRRPRGRSARRYPPATIRRLSSSADGCGVEEPDAVRLLAREFSREAGVNPETDLHSRLLAAFLVSGNFSVARAAFEEIHPASIPTPRWPISIWWRLGSHGARF